MDYKILLVDDNRLITGLISKLLHSLGYEVTIAHSGREALKVIHKIKPKVVLLDISMPVVNGYEVAKKIREDVRFSETVLIAFSGKCKLIDKLKAREVGFDHHIHKSASVNEIKMILNAYDY